MVITNLLIDWLMVETYEISVYHQFEMRMVLFLLSFFLRKK